MCMISTWLERSKAWTTCGKPCRKKSTLKIQRHCEIKCVLIAHKERQRLIAKRFGPKPSYSRNDEKEQTKEKHSLEEITAWSYDVEGHAEKCIEIYYASAKNVSSLQQVATPCIDDHLTPPEHNETTGELSAVGAQIVLTCL